MAGKVTVRVELTDGTVIQHESSWYGGNPLFEAWEAKGGSEVSTTKVVTAIESMYGKKP